MGYFTDALMSYGADAMLITPDGEMSVKIMLNPEHVRGEGYDYTSLGKVNIVRYRCILDGSIDAGTVQNSTLLFEGREYKVISAEKYMVEGAPSHIEAVLRPMEEVYRDGN